MSSNFLQVPANHTGRQRLPLQPLQVEITLQERATLHEIPCSHIGASELNSLLTSLFPGGGYNVDVEQDVYRIRAPRPISQGEVNKFRIM
ncbi:hypothetical protein C8A03DRAFT_36772 [Achaetomium macrosporum]|uniref:Uncharacterized protein n=1 Tax=Achaetomium macrosporum TaxID=79813 RepID=A0AAN7H535_9PEZI|nr:hypothetical protein C8A03DRAFT_36772 [Achaetomium macrosporum]